MIRRNAGPLAAAAICALAYLAYVSHYSLDVPVADDWGVIPLASGAVHRYLPMADLWSQYGDTRLFVGRLSFAAFGAFDHLNERHIMLCSALTYIASFVMLLFLFRSYLRRRLTFLAVFSVGIAWFSLAGFQNALWSFQLAWYLVVFFFVAMVSFLLLRRRHPNLLFALAAVAAVLASLTEVQGFVVWPVGLVCLVWTSPWGRRTYSESAIWTATALLTAAVYLHNFNFTDATNICRIEGGSAAGCSLTYGLRHPIPLAKFLAILAGNVVPTDPGRYVGFHELLGAAIWVAAGFVVVQSIRTRRGGTSPLPVVLIAFALLFDVVLALSRLGQGAAGAGKTWYTMPNIILVSGIVIYAWTLVPDPRTTREGTGPRRVLGIIGGVALAGFLVVQLVVATNFGIAHGRIVRAGNVVNARVLANLGEIPDAKRDCYLASVAAGPPLAFIYSSVALAQRDELTLFRSGASDRYRALGPPSLPQCD